jgi:O-antigen/teichoic acid export membrane protein
VGAWATALLVSSAVGGWLNRHDFGLAPARHVAGRLLRLGLPLAPAIAVLWISDFGVRAILVTSSGSDAVGFFSVAVRLASVASLALFAFQFAWQPLALEGDGVQSPRRRADIRGFIAASSALVTLIGFAGPELVAILAHESFKPAIPVIAALGTSVVVQAVVVVTSTQLLAQGRSGVLAFATTLGALTGLGVAWVLAPPLGATGAAIGIVVGQSATAALSLASLGGVAPSWLDRRVAAVVGITIAALAVMVVAPDLSPGARGMTLVAWILAIAAVGVWRDVIGLVRAS